VLGRPWTICRQLIGQESESRQLHGRQFPGLRLTNQIRQIGNAPQNRGGSGRTLALGIRLAPRDDPNEIGAVVQLPQADSAKECPRSVFSSGKHTFILGTPRSSGGFGDREERAMADDDKEPMEAGGTGGDGRAAANDEDPASAGRPDI
jgi:hypothetical protein